MSRGNPIEKRFLSATDTDLVDQFFRLFHSTFELETREPDEQIWEELRGEYRLPIRIAAYVEGLTLRGFARYTELPGMDAAWLIQIAVEEEWRGHGFGSWILTDLLKSIDPPIFVEVDSGSPVESWYRRFGFVDVWPNYRQPALHAMTEPVALRLMASEAIEDPRSAVKQYYRRAWHLDETSELVQAVLG